jgi:hypothetical protein
MTPDTRESRSGSVFHSYAVAVLIAACALFGFSLNRYPSPYVDEPYFTQPALSAATGGPFAYPMSSQAPFASQVWAYHGPLLPRLLELLIHLFGLHIWLIRLPDFLGAWLAALIVILFLNRRGYRTAGLAFAVLWCGCRTVQEVMYARMDGLALLFLTLGFLALWHRRSVLAGLVLGAACLLQPFCLAFVFLGLVVTFVDDRPRLLHYVGGAVLNIPILAALWGGRVSESVQQFLWHGHRFEQGSLSSSVLLLFHVLRWSRYWAFTVVILTLVMGAYAALTLKRGITASWQRDLVLAVTFALAGLTILLHKGTKPYYLVYLSIWVMLALAIFAEERWRTARLFVIPVLALWMTSAAWNLMRIRESVLYYRELSDAHVINLLHKNVPAAATIVSTPEAWPFPIEGGYRFLNTTWLPEEQSACPKCYLLMTQDDFDQGKFFAPASLANRTVLYDGPAFPAARSLEFPIVLLSPTGPHAPINTTALLVR